MIFQYDAYFCKKTKTFLHCKLIIKLTSGLMKKLQTHWKVSE